MNKLILLAGATASLFASTEAAIAVTGGPDFTLYKGGAVAVTGITSGNHLCWNAAAAGAATARTCVVAGAVTDIGATGCSAQINAGVT